MNIQAWDDPRDDARIEANRDAWDSVGIVECKECGEMFADVENFGMCPDCASESAGEVGTIGRERR